MKDISISTNTLFVCSFYYDKIYNHLKLMNSWKDDPVFCKQHPLLAEHDFTLQDALQDLLMKGGL